MKSRDIDQRIASFDSSRLTITQMPKIKDVAMVKVPLSYEKGSSLTGNYALNP